MSTAGARGEALRRRQSILDTMARACRSAARDRADATLIAVSKTRTVDAIRALLAAGQRDFGESRVQEAQEKWPLLRAEFPDARLHLIGRLQSNKAQDAVRLFDSIHSLDRTSLLEALVVAAERTGRTPEVYIQVNIGSEAQKGGVAIDELPGLIERVRATTLPLAGLMAVPPNGLEPGPFFALLAKLARRHGVTGLSMGMSADYESALMLGATAIRVGTALFED